MFSVLLVTLLSVAVLGQHNMSPDGMNNDPFIPPNGGPTWWPADEFVDATMKLLPNPGASMFAFQFNGPDFGKNFISLPRSLSADLPRAMTIELWAWVPPADQRAEQEYLPLVSRFNPRLTTGPENLDSYNDFGFEIAHNSSLLRFWMGGQHDVDYGFDINSGVPVPTGKWTHLAVSVVSSASRNPYMCELFIDGVKVASQNWKSGAIRIFQTVEAIAIGHRQKGNEPYYFEGVLDDVRFWGTERKEADIKATMHKSLDGDEESLVAVYRLDNVGSGAISDSGPAAHHGYTIRPLYTLAAPPSLNRRELGVQGLPVDIQLAAVDLVPTAASGFEYTLSCVPEHGCVSVDGDPKGECLAEVDLGVRVLPAGVVQYTGDDDYLGDDQICVQARRVGETQWSDTAIIELNVIEAPATGCLTQFDQCGVCGGDGTSCTTGGCDGKGGQFDQCMVCGGDNSTCMCAVYKSYKLNEMDCILFDHAINRTLVRIDNSIELLVDTLDGLQHYDSCDPTNTLDLLSQIRHLCSIKNCVADYVNELAGFIDTSDQFLATAYLCPEKEQPRLLTHYERERMMQ